MSKELFDALESVHSLPTGNATIDEVASALQTHLHVTWNKKTQLSIVHMAVGLCCSASLRGRINQHNLNMFDVVVQEGRGIILSDIQGPAQTFSSKIVIALQNEGF